MKQEINAIRNDVHQLTQHARALLVATSDIASETVVEARDKLAAVLERGQDSAEVMRDRIVDSACYCRDTIRKHPYESLAIGLAIGAVIGLLSVRHYSDRCK
jgi:ElaB/YqjD/DUF883 family membrane-anchored ribosome-binding protein